MAATGRDPRGGPGFGARDACDRCMEANIAWRSWRWRSPPARAQQKTGITEDHVPDGRELKELIE
jgi:hypothetical protein